MFRSYLKIIFKNFISHKLYSLINVLGLGLGLSVCLMIALFVHHELSYDRYHENAERLYLVNQIDVDRPELRPSGSSYHTVAALMEQDFPQVEEAARITGRDTFLTYGEFSSFETGIQFADPSLFSLFNFTWLAGDPAAALNEERSIVLTQSLAEKYFGDEDPMGRTITMENRFDLLVTGLIADLPDNTHMSAEAFVPLSFFDDFTDGQFSGPGVFFSVQTYLLLREGAELSEVTGQFADFSARHFPVTNRQPYNWRFDAQEVTSIHLDEGFQGPNSMSNLARVNIFAAIAAGILLIAVTNFMNLSTARSSRRALEMGMRLTVGARRTQIIRQFLAESVVMVTCAMLVAVLLAELLLPVVSSILFVPLSLEAFANPPAILALIIATLVIGIAAGSYPAFYLSSYKPAKVLKGEVTKGRAGAALRNTLVVGQFAISIAMIVVSLVVYLQMRFIQELDLGFNQDQVVVIGLPEQDVFNAETLWPALESQLLAHGNIEAATYSLSTPLRGFNMRLPVSKAGESQSGQPMRLIFNLVKDSYFSTLEMEFIAGRDFSLASETIPSFTSLMTWDPEAASSSGSLILNETAARQLGWTPEEAVGNTLSLTDGRNTATVIGVVRDTVNSARDEARAMVYAMPETMEFPFGGGGQLSIRMAGDGIPATMAHIEEVWDAYLPGQPMEPQFATVLWDGLYVQERQQMQMFSTSALIAVLVACFGLYGLASFNAERRTKEIGVRKVMGGSVWNIVLLLTNDFSKLVLISNLIAWPVAYIAMNHWLENFAYRIDLTPLIFIGSGLIALCIAWVTVGGTAARAASAKPVLALRYE